MKLVLVAVLMFFVSPAFGEEWGVVFGIHQTDAQPRFGDESVTPQIGYRFGITTSFFVLDEVLKLRTGLLFTEHTFKLSSGPVDATYELQFLEVPALFQYNFTPKFGAFTGLMAAFNIRDQVSGPHSAN